MSATEVHSASPDAAVGKVDMHLEIDVIPVSDVDRSALQRAEAAHVEHQKRTGRSHLFHRSDQDENWPAWYAAYMVAEQAGTDMPT
jgi:hypothetical protein